MTEQEVVALLSNLGKRLNTLADQACETREQAHHVLQRITLLREEVNQWKHRLIEEAKANR
ncbi:MAG TPA: hypothetical protein VN688_01080 [Gemmataceae bacterium]|nr:hypothetical protein [Gemmataceae bacterium]